MEDLIIEERELRNRQISKERQIWEREVRILRETLAPFYHTEADLTRRLLDLEGKTDQTYEGHSLLKERLATLDKTSMTLERRLDNCELSRCRKRKAGLGQEETGIMSPGSNYTCSETSVSDATSVTTHKSPQAPSPLNPPLPASPFTTSPRSSGILRLSSAAHYSNGHTAYVNHHKRRLPASNIEPRSSGFLSIDLAERLRNQRLEQPQHGEPALSAIHDGPRASAYMKKSGLPSPPHNEVSAGALPVSALLSKSIGRKMESRSPKKLKQHNDGMTGLELLANVAGPLAQQS
ncbi:hypothetical protein LTR70_000567 [Exophiala xenobiotica]|uniref:Uncharacterized protein n=1 Tax=Lithohypha guttulata TaxID=1690604 RepID=A0ABR0KIS0_9EURO|nr:hypothetical protein LTR24_002186 [Lithohypha guttulata]KAK5329418.1 hypothetical protein LTR70_000567 [Exophiala xenobiotica]